MIRLNTNINICKELITKYYALALQGGQGYGQQGGIGQQGIGQQGVSQQGGLGQQVRRPLSFSL